MCFYPYVIIIDSENRSKCEKNNKTDFKNVFFTYYNKISLTIRRLVNNRLQ